MDLEENVVRSIPVEKKFRIQLTGEVRITQNGNSFLECTTDQGTVAFWGKEGAMANINVIASTEAPFSVTCGCIDSNWEKHAYWVPQNAKIEILEERE